MKDPAPIGRRDLFIASALAVLYVALLLHTAGAIGYARDEGFYFHAATVYGRWFEQLLASPSEALGAKAVDAAWSVNHEHPSLAKSLFALSHLVLFERMHLFALEGTSFRFPAMAMSGLAVAVTYLWGARARGRTAGMAAALLLAATPHFFHHAHLACFDAPIVGMWLLAAYAYARSLERPGLRGPVLAGLAFGLALDTKHNAWFLPVACLAHAALSAAWRHRAGAPTVRRVQLRRAFASLCAMAVLGPLVTWALWPWLWRSPRARVAEYVGFHVNHVYYNMEFLGRNYWAPPMPRAYAWVMTAATVPAITLCLFAVGLAIVAAAAVAKLRAPGRSAPPSSELLWLLGIGVSYGAWLLPRTPIFGGTKHWMTAYPFICLFAGVAFAEIVKVARAEAARRLPRALAGPLPEMALGLSILAAPVVESARAQPWGLSAYTPLVGGSAGAATLGLNRGFWGYTTLAVADYLDEEVPPGGSVYIHDTAAPAWEMLQREGRVRADLRAAPSVAGADFALYHHEMHMEGQEYQAWVALGTTRPNRVAGLDGVPILLVYRR